MLRKSAISCGAYLYDFTYQKDATAPRAFLNFEGVASCFYVWLNGQFVGYSQVAHSTSEFDVTKFLQDGTNHLAVLVLKWCDGSYMEDQDMFRMSGIHREAYLEARQKLHTQDVYLTTQLSNDLKQAKLNVQLQVLNMGKKVRDIKADVALIGPDGKTVAKGIVGHSEPVVKGGTATLNMS